MADVVYVVTATNGQGDLFESTSMHLNEDSALTLQELLIDGKRLMHNGPGYNWDLEPQPITFALYGPFALEKPALVVEERYD